MTGTPVTPAHAPRTAFDTLSLGRAVAVRGLWPWIARRVALQRQRRALRALDRRLLRDVGLTPGQARTEAARPFWDAPAHWRG